MVVFAKYFTSGVCAVSVHFLTMIVLVEMFSSPPLAASFAGFCAGSIANYKLQYGWTFSSEVCHKLAFTRYIKVTATTLLLNLLIFETGIHLIQLDYRMSQLVATILVFFANYIINARYTFQVQQKF